MRFSIRVLGPIEVLDDGVPVRVGREQVRTLLAVLASASGHPVTADLLEYALWPQDAPASPRSALHNRVFHARAVFGESGTDVIVAEGDSYLLSPGACGTDVAEWLETVGEARRAATSDRLDRAVERFATARSMWRGRPFDGVTESEHFERERRRLEQARTDAELDEARVLLQAGRPADAAPLATTTLAREPFREDVVCAAIDALAATGHRAEGLAEAARFRDRLRTELGVSPSPTFDATERSLLDGGRAPSAAPSRRSVWHAGRLETATQALDSALAGGAGRAVVVVSPPRHGLSTFLSRIAEHVEETRPDVDLRHLHHRAGADHTLRRDLGTPYSTDHHVRGLTLAIDHITARAAERPVVLVIDDVTELDQWSIDLLDMLMRGPVPAGVILVVGAHRSDAAGGHRRSDWLDRPDAIVLERLERDDVEALLRERCPALSTSDRHRLTARILAWCGGDPHAVCGAVDAVVRDGPACEFAVPRPVARHIHDVVRALGDDTNDLLRTAAGLGESVDGTVLAAVTGTTTEEVVRRLGLAAAQGLLVRATRPGWWVFADRLTREAVAAGLDETARLEAHAAAGLWLLETRGDLRRAARHLVEGVPLVDADVAADAARRAAGLLVDDARYGEAAFLLRAAASLAPTLRDGDPDRLGAAAALERTGDHSDADALYGDVMGRCGPEDGDLLTAAALGGSGRSSRIGGQEPRRNRLVLAHRRLAPDHPRAGEVVAELGLELLIAGRPIPEPVREDLHTVAGDPDAPANHLALRVLLVIEELRTGTTFAEAERLADLALTAIDRRGDGLGGASLAVACHLACALGAWHRADDWIAELGLFGARTGEPRSRWQSLAYRAALTEARGPEGAADEQALHAREVGLQLGIADAEQTFRLHWLGRAMRMGGLALAADDLARLGPPYDRFPVLRVLRGLAELDRGREADARVLLADACAAMQTSIDTFRPAALALACLLASRMQEVTVAEDMATQLAPRAGGMAFLGYGGPFLGPYDWFRAVAAEASGDIGRAERLTADAVAACGRAGAAAWRPRRLAELRSP